MNVFILTYCRAVEKLYGSTLTLKSIRTGFPTAKIHVSDNASIPEAQIEIARLCKEVGATYTHIKNEIHHHDFLRWVLSRDVDGPVFIVDPDIQFWSSCEGFKTDGLLSGRLIPTHFNPAAQANELPRLHTSFWFIPDLRLLQAAIATLPPPHLSYDAFRPTTFRLGEAYWRIETGGNLYLSLAENITPFTEAELDCYDHLLAGSHLSAVLPSLTPSDASSIIQSHIDAQFAPEKLRGLWRKQEAYYQRNLR